MKIRLGTKSLVKLSKISVGLLSVLVIGYFFFAFVLPVFAVINTGQTYVNTTVFPDKFSKNGTAEGFNFTVTASTGNISQVNITIPNSSATATNFTIDITNDIPFTNATGTWNIFYTNYTA